MFHAMNFKQTADIFVSLAVNPFIAYYYAIYSKRSNQSGLIACWGSSMNNNDSDRIGASREDSDANLRKEECSGDGCVLAWKPKRRSDKVYEALFGTYNRRVTVGTA
jgi:hypothetical protein